MLTHVQVIVLLLRSSHVEQVRECQRSKFFRQDQFGKWHPCQEHDEGSQRKTIFEIEGDSLAVPAVEKRHFEAVRLTMLGSCVNKWCFRGVA